VKPWPTHPQKILVRSTNWIGDAVMTTPAVRTIRDNFPESEISMLVHPWVSDVFRFSPRVDRLMLYEKKGRHKGMKGLLQLAGELRQEQFDCAILLQNAFEAALLTRLAGIPVRGGYTTDGRSLLLTHGVQKINELNKKHEVNYYQRIMLGLGFHPAPNDLELFIPGDQVDRAKQNKAGAATSHIIDLTGATTLIEAMALIGECDVFVTNDSGLMHVAAALRTPLVAIFGSTDHIATGPFSDNAVVIRKSLACSPCKKTHCPEKHFRCMKLIDSKEVCAAVLRILKEA